jgi:hypothetical protein
MKTRAPNAATESGAGGVSDQGRQLQLEASSRAAFEACADRKLTDV